LVLDDDPRYAASDGVRVAELRESPPDAGSAQICARNGTRPLTAALGR
jgi:hypothetical protein